MIFMIFTYLFNINVSNKLSFTSLQNLLLTKKKTSKFIYLIKKAKIYTNLHQLKNPNLLPILHIIEKPRTRSSLTCLVLTKVVRRPWWDVILSKNWGGQSRRCCLQELEESSTSSSMSQLHCWGPPRKWHPYPQPHKATKVEKEERKKKSLIKMRD